MSQHFTCYAFDMLGHGESDKPTRHFNMPDYAQALDDACQLLNIHRGHYVGNSVGACLAAEMAATFPDRLDKLVLVGCPVWDPRTAAQRVKESEGDYKRDGTPKLRNLAGLKERTTFVHPRKEWVDATNQTRAQAGIWVKNVHNVLAHYDIMARLPMIQTRATLVMYGEHDRLREGEELLQNNIVNASKTILPGLGHIPQIEDPELFVDSLLQFLKP
jgi:pimeloyl-ACP methyl ester carboxylesterase